MQRKLTLRKWFTSPDNTGETGQAIILIAVAALVLVAIMGLAIDGGRLLFLKRETQNASDAAALAAARALCLERVDWKDAGEAAAAANGFVDGDNGDVVEIVSPPTKASIDIGPECYGCYVEVTIGGEIPASFIGIVYDGPLVTTSYAIGACNPNQFNFMDDDVPDLRAMFGLSPGCEVNVTGSNIEIAGGTHANGDLKIIPKVGGGIVVGPSSYTGDLQDPGPGDGKVQWCPGEPGCPDGYGGGGGGYSTPAGLCAPSCFVDPDAEEEDDDEGCVPGQFPMDNPFKECDVQKDPLGYDAFLDYGPGSTAALAAEADGGRYYNYTGACTDKDVEDWIDSHITASVLDTGLYYFGACDVTLNKFDGFSGEITWVTQGSIKISGGSQNLKAYTDDLLFFAEGGGGTCTGRGVELPGNKNTLEGNIYAPYGEVKFSNSNGILYGCIVALQPNFSGSNSKIICEEGIAATGGDPGVWLPE